ncbi:DUF488 domain-containing protein [Candidatus Woesearchaeota archaeon]|nr:DUF488 domain-containing protein [Candidatus Woesearchaeota archaeon]
MTGYVYSKYAQYTIKSELVKKDRNTAHRAGFNTIGYEGKDIDAFLDVLIQNNINMVVDVRNNPFSMNFCFTKNNLSKFLDSAGIQYVHVPELGVESRDRKNLKSKEDYAKLFLRYRQTLENRKGCLEKVVQLGRKSNIVLLCLEANASFCHRSEIARFLRKQGLKVEDL